MQESIVFLVRAQCRRKESSRSLSHLLVSFLYITQRVNVPIRHLEQNGLVLVLKLDLGLGPEKKN